MNGMWLASYVALWLIVAILSFIVMGLLRQFGLIQMRVGIEPGVLITDEGLARGELAPDFEAQEVSTGGVFRLRELRGRRVVLVFLTPSCEDCQGLAKQLGRIAKEWNDHVFLAVCYGSGEACREFARGTVMGVPLLDDEQRTVVTAYRVSSTPLAYLISEDGFVLIRGIVNTWPHLEALLEERGTLRTSVSLDQVVARVDSLSASVADHSYPDGAVSTGVPAPAAGGKDGR